MAYRMPNEREDFHIAIICALEDERDCVYDLLESDFENLGRKYGKAPKDDNSYTCGILAGMPVVLAYPSEIGSLSAAAVAKDMSHSFTEIKLALVVGVAGGAPHTPEGDEIRLGDVIVSTIVVRYDFGRQYEDGFYSKQEVETTLGRPSRSISNLLAKSKGRGGRARITTKVNASAKSNCTYPGQFEDHLFPASYRHKHHDPKICDTCANCNNWYDPTCDEAKLSSCEKLGCNKPPCRILSTTGTNPTPEQLSLIKAYRPVQIHFGRVASGNGVIKSALHRDRLMQKEKVIGFEMEGAGTWDSLPTIVVKSVCDYADSHKNKKWQKWCAATAASCAMAIIEEWDEEQPSGT